MKWLLAKVRYERPADDGNSNANRFVEDVKRATGKPTCWAKNGTVLPFDLYPL